MEIIRVELTMAPEQGRKSDGEDLNNKARKKHQGEQVKERRDKDYYDFIRLYDGMEINERDNYQKQLKETEPFKKQLQFDVRRPQVILKMKSNNLDREDIFIHPGDLTKSCNISICASKISITKETNATSALLLSLRRLGLEHLNNHQFHLVEIVVLLKESLIKMNVSGIWLNA